MSYFSFHPYHVFSCAISRDSYIEGTGDELSLHYPKYLCVLVTNFLSNILNIYVDIANY